MSAHEKYRPRGILGYFVAHPTAANLLMALMLVGGLWSAFNLRAQFFPDVVQETMIVSVSWTGAGAEDMDHGVVEVLEPSLIAVENVASVRSNSREGSASITLEFDPGANMMQAAEDVQAAVDGLRRSLPAESEVPTIRRGGWSDRVVDVSISGPVGIELLARYADELKAALFRAGVQQATISGVTNPNIRVEAPNGALEREGLTLNDVAGAITGAYKASPAGELEAAQARIRVGADRTTAYEIAETPVAVRPDGARILVRDVAEVREDGLDSGVAYFRGDQPAVLVSVSRGPTGDALKLRAAVRETVEAIAPTLPAGVEMTLIRDRAESISGRLQILISNGVMGLVLVLVSLFLFLNASMAFWVAAGIATATAATLAVMYFMGMTLNSMSLFALIICLGVAVDDAIVVGDYADWMRRRGFGPGAAAERAARRMLGPVIAASATTILAFGALLLIGGRFGDMIKDIPMTIAAVLIASLFESFVILPAHMRHAMSKPKKANPWYDAPSRFVDKGFTWFVEVLFRPFIAFILRIRYVVVAAMVMLLMISASIFVEGKLRWRFFSSPEQGEITAYFAMLDGSTRADSIAMSAEMDRALEAVNRRFEAEYGRAPVATALGRVGSAGRGLSNVEAKDADLLGAFEVELIDPDLRPYAQQEIIRAWTAEIEPHPRMEQLSLTGARSFGGGDGINVRLSGANAEVLKAAAEDLKLRLGQVSGVSALEDTLSYDKVEYVVALNAQGRAAGFTEATLAAEMRRKLTGIEAAEFVRDGRTVKVVVEPPDAEIRADYLTNVRLRSPSGTYMALSEIADLTTRQGFASVRREGGLRVATVTGDLAEDPALQNEARRILAEEILPEVTARHGVSSEQGGALANERQFLGDAVNGFVMAMVGIYLTLAWILGSWTRPVIIMSVIPLGMIGVIWGHHLHNEALSMYSIIGVIGVAGIIVNDSIVLVTTVDEYSPKRGLLPSIVQGACDRLRAVFLTTITTVLGTAPLLLETSVQAQFLKPTVISLVYGLGLGSTLVLVVVPAVLAIQQDLSLSLKASGRMLWGGARKRKGLGGGRKPLTEPLPAAPTPEELDAYAIRQAAE
ncbi:efflux RND transporter permease subunit [Neomegalonema perideroedes]|uniref:efflux RND transporter permease subunit n=1 Tax=Neomegalonema perideroedes TaxID=217219 RepID=UPI000360565C|nr:efflux RND transporter permease subunit [Neomegalonema perideroedes]